MHTLQALSWAGRLGVCFLAYNSQISRSPAASSSSSWAVDELLRAGNRCRGQWFKSLALPSSSGQRKGMGRGEDKGKGHFLPCTQGKMKGQGSISPTHGDRTPNPSLIPL